MFDLQQQRVVNGSLAARLLRIVGTLEKELFDSPEPCGTGCSFNEDKVGLALAELKQVCGV